MDVSHREGQPVAVITGGTAGIGRATANLLAEKGYALAIIARGKEGLEKARRELSPRTRVETYECDVSDDGAVQETAARIAREMGGIDVWVNNAMLTMLAPFTRYSTEEFDAIFDTTFKGYVHGMRAALKHMTRGNVINVSSALAYRSVPLQSAYCAAKAAVNGLTASIRSELIHEGRDIAVSLITLPGLNTPQFDWNKVKMPQKPRPAAPVYDPAVAAKAVWKAIQEDSREVIVGRAAIGLTFAQMAAPDYLDHKLSEQGYDGQQDDNIPASHNPEDGNIFEPVDEEHYYGARGEHYGDEAEQSALTVDGDMARYSLFGAGALLATGLGILIGASAGRTKAHKEIEADQRDFEQRRRVARANGLHDRADELRYDQPVLADASMTGSRGETVTDIAVQGATASDRG